MECKKAVPKEEGAGDTGSSAPSSVEGGAGSSTGGSGSGHARTRKIFVGGLSPAVDDAALQQHFEQFGAVEDAVVMFDHDSKRPRGFGFVTFAAEESVDQVGGALQTSRARRECSSARSRPRPRPTHAPCRPVHAQVFGRGVMQTIADKQIEIKPAVPRDQMPSGGSGRRGGGGGGMGYFEGGGMRGGYGGGRGGYHSHPQHHGYGGGMGGGMGGGGYGGGGGGGMFKGYGPRGAYGMGPAGQRAGRGGGGVPGYGFAVQQRGGGYGGMGMGGKMPPMGYDLYGPGLQNGGAGPGGAGGIFAGSNAQALYNLASMQPHHFNGMGQQPQQPQQPPQQQPQQQQPGGKQLNTFDMHNFKALALASTLGGFPTGQPEGGGGGAFSQEDPAGSSFPGAQAADYAAAAEAAAAANLTAASAANGLTPDFNTYDTGFTTSPAPGWSS